MMNNYQMQDIERAQLEPSGYAEYMATYGGHFSKKMCEWAVGMMKVEEKRPNQAFTYSKGKCTCIYIGWTTSGEEFINSMIHEIRHLVDHIADAYCLDTKGEDVGYMSGDAAYLLAEDICEHGCKHCRKDER